MFAKEIYVLLFLVLFSINILSCFAITCKDESGKNVDWFVVYKLPILDKGDGLSYVFVTSNKENGGWTLSQRRISDANSLFGTTIKPLFSNSGEKYTKILYSDQTPDGKTYSTNAHAKGVIAMDSNTGFWLTHSIPRYPSALNEPYKYPPSGDDYGQTALCISFVTSKEAVNIINHLLVIRPKVYSSFFEKKTMDIVQNLKSLEENKWSKSKFLRNSVKSLGNYEFITFAKSPKVVDDLYENHIAPFIKSGLIVESWRKGIGTKLPSVCKQYNILNVEEVSLSVSSGKSIGVWSYTKDHSKWSISEDETKSFVCIADLNRMLSQNKRGGGAVCLHNAGVWNLFQESISVTEKCPTRSKA